MESPMTPPKKKTLIKNRRAAKEIMGGLLSTMASGISNQPVQQPVLRGKAENEYDKGIEQNDSENEQIVEQQAFEHEFAD